MADRLVAPPVLPTPDAHIFEDPTPVASPLIPLSSQRWTSEEIYNVYEVARTSEEIRAGGWRRIALQFPDSMLRDAPGVFEALQSTLNKFPENQPDSNPRERRTKTSTSLVDDVADDFQEVDIVEPESSKVLRSRRRLFILADTSYGACCVDEIAAEHVDADVVVHYGRSCLSPTARLPVIYVFTSQPLVHGPVIAAFEELFPQKDSKVVLLADIIYADHVPAIHESLKRRGYSNLFSPSIIHDPSSLLPNRTIPPPIIAGDDNLNNYSIFHISDPPASLLLTLSSRVQSMYIYPTGAASSPRVLQAQTSRQLRRRYALLTSLNTCSIFGILVNTLSVKNYLATISKIQAQITAAGKKSYTFVVGKVNAAKVANFSEIGGWIVVGCWESSLIESTEFYRPIITPFELQLTLMSDEERVWTGEWTGDFSSILAEKPPISSKGRTNHTLENDGEIGDEEDSAPPEFDLRTGRYVSHSRPMRTTIISNAKMSGAAVPSASSSALTKRANGDVTTINGTASPGAEYLRSQRTWKGLGSDFEIAYEEDERGAAVEQGRSGVARGYIVRDDDERR